MSQPSYDQCIKRARRYLGVKDVDPEFPTTHLLDVANTCVSDLYDDCIRLNESEAAVSATLAALSSASRVYDLSAQGNTALTVLRVLSLRLNDEDGAALSYADLSQLDAYRGMFYTLTGSEGAQQIVVANGVSSGATLFMRYVPILAESTDPDAALPAFIPARYRDLVALMIARETWSQGGEADMPMALLGRLEDRHSQLCEVWSKRSPDPLLRRDVGGGIAPYTV
jgi:hypothetical protein